MPVDRRLLWIDIRLFGCWVAPAARRKIGPTSLLDGVVRWPARFGSRLTELHRRHLVGEVDQQVEASIALGVADHVYILRNGSIVFEGSPTELSAEEFTKKIYLSG